MKMTAQDINDLRKQLPTPTTVQYMQEQKPKFLLCY